MATLAFIGTGVMGASMAGHLLFAGHAVRVHTRTPARAAALLERGAVWAPTAREAADGVDLAISIVGMPEDVEAVHLGPGGTLEAPTPPRAIVDMTTSRPSLAIRLAETARRRGVGAIDAPVSGGDIGARNAALSIMIGGDDADVALATPILECLGKTIVHHGGPGAGQHAKMVNQILIAAGMLGLCEGLRYAESAGLDSQKVIESVSVGAAGSWAVSNLGPRILRGDFEPGFMIDHFLKDLRIALDEAKRMNLDLQATTLAERLYSLAESQGLGRRGTQALWCAEW